METGIVWGRKKKMPWCFKNNKNKMNIQHLELEMKNYKCNLKRHTVKTEVAML